MWNPFKKAGEARLVFGKYEYINTDDGPNMERGSENLGVEFKKVEPVIKKEPEVVNDEELTERPFLKLRRTIRVLLLALITLVPVWFLPFSSPGDVLTAPKQLLIFGLMMTSLVIWLIIMVRQGGLVFRRSGWEWGVLAVLGAGFLGSVFSSLVYNSFLASGGFITLASLAVFFWLVINFFEKKDYYRLINFFLFGVTVAVLGGLFEVWGWPLMSRLAGISGLGAGSFFNTVGSANSLGALAVLGLVLFTAYYFDPFHRGGDLFKSLAGYSKFWQIAHWIGFGSFVAWIFIANWAVLYVGLMVGMLGIILGLGLAAKLTGQKAKLNPLDMVLPMILLVGSIMLILGGRYFDVDASRILKQSLAPEATVSQRGSWVIAKDIINTEPLLGMGKENFVAAYDLFKPISINSTVFWTQRFNNGASEFFNLLIEDGLLGLAALVFLLFYVLRSAFSKNDSPPFYIWAVLPCFLASLAIFALHSFNFVLLTSFWFLLALMALGVSADQPKIKIKMDEASVLSLGASLGFVLVLIMGVVGGYLLIQKYTAQIYFAQAGRVTGASQQDLDRQMELLNKASKINKHEDVYRYSLASVALRRIDMELNNKTGKPEEVRAKLEELTRTTVQTAQQMTEQNKNNGLNWYNAGFVYENLAVVLSGADSAAIASYTEYLKLAPRDPNGYFRLGTLYLAMADRNSSAIAGAKSKGAPLKNEKEVAGSVASALKNAEDNFKKAVELKPDLAVAVYSLGIVYERQNLVKEAIAQLEPIRNANLKNPNLAFELALLYYRGGLKDKAIEEMQRAISLFENYANARWYLALMYEEKGEIDKAIEQLKEILKSDINKDQPAVLQKIASLEEGKREFPPAKVTSKRPL